MVASAATFDGGDGHEALAIAAEGSNPMVEVVLQYVRA
jgi:hypothetical protein